MTAGFGSKPQVSEYRVALKCGRSVFTAQATQQTVREGCTVGVGELHAPANKLKIRCQGLCQSIASRVVDLGEGGGKRNQ